MFYTHFLPKYCLPFVGGIDETCVVCDNILLLVILLTICYESKLNDYGINKPQYNFGNNSYLCDKLEVSLLDILIIH